MRKGRLALAVLVLLILVSAAYLFVRRASHSASRDTPFAGSSSCRGCHQAFYERWAPSHHGLAMQPYTAAFARANLRPAATEISVVNRSWVVDLTGRKGWMIERGPGGESRYEIQHAMGGKNVYYFLTPMNGGRLQVLPLAFDVRTRTWYDTAASAVRHFPDMPDSPLHWTERPFTFNSSCWGCHVSQLETNYDPATDTYKSAWAEPGINCETCHGPAAEHVRLFQKTKSATPPPDLRIIKTSRFDAEQTNTMCAPCHAKMVPLTATFRPGDRYFDHFDLVAMEHPDFYPDGRDLGENYTYTSWRASPCLVSGKLDCLHCHTSSGRYRFEGDKANRACLPCHQDKVSDPAPHTHHAAQSAGSRCVVCHMPATEFARMRRSDHSMRPPTPAATIRFQSPNACGICHTDRDASWADKAVRAWHKRDYQAPVLRRAALIDAARKGDWSRLEEMLEYVASKEREEITAASLIRLLRHSDNPSVQPVLIECLRDSSPLVRSSAADALALNLTPEVVDALSRAASDEYRVVRIRAASALSRAPREALQPTVDRAMTEFEQSMQTRADDPAALANLGSFYASRGDLAQSITAFEASLKLQSDSIPALVNASLAYNQAGRNREAEECLRRALKVDSKNAAANFNLGLLLGEQGRGNEARQALRRALEAEPDLAAAAYNLCVLEAEDNLDSALALCGKAAALRPAEPKYAYTLAFYQYQNRQISEAARLLRRLLEKRPDYADARLLLNQIQTDTSR